MKRGIRRQANRQSGFTLMEVMLVLVIIAAIAGIAVMNLGAVQDRANVKTAQADIGVFKGYLDFYKFEVGSYPNKLEDMHTQPGDLPDPSKWLQVIKDPPRNDPWGNPYEYKPSGDTFDLRSMGPDKQSGTDDDVK